MFQTSQCVTSIFELLLSAGSGSCISRTKLCVPGGTCDHLSSGDGASGPAACVYLSGMTPPSSQAVVVMRSGGVCGPRPRPCPPPAGGPCARSAALVATIIEATNADFIVSFPVRLKADTTYFSSNFSLRLRRRITRSKVGGHRPQLRHELEAEVRGAGPRRPDERARVVHRQRGGV